jgi:hypothetical protein
MLNIWFSVVLAVADYAWAVVAVLAGIRPEHYR